MELKLLQRDIMYRGRVFDLIVDQVAYPSGNRSVREVARHPGGAVIFPMFDDGSLLLVSQLRYPLGRHLLEAPAGKLLPEEDPRTAAARELQEETGWCAGSLEKLLSIHTTPGFCDEVLHLFLATGLFPAESGHTREEGESTMDVRRVLLSEALHLVDTGEISDAKTITGLLFLHRRLHIR